MELKLISWLDSKLVEDWRLAHKFQSVQIAIFWAVISGAWLALPAFYNFLSPPKFAGLCIAFSLAVCFARLTKQPGLTV